MLKPAIVARCGDVQTCPESTLPAFEQAIRGGADAIEFDVHLTTDGQLVVHHDFYLGRTDNGSGHIGEYTLAELRRLDAGSWFNPTFCGEKIPTLSEVLDLGKGKIRFEIDMKGSSLRFLNRLIEEIARFDLLQDVELTTAHTPLFFHIKHINPALRTGMFFSQLPAWMQPSLGQQHILDWMALSNTQVAHLHPSLITPEFVSSLQEKGYLVHGSNLNTQEEMQGGMASGIDQFSTGNLALAISMRAAPSLDF